MDFNGVLIINDNDIDELLDLMNQYKFRIKSAHLGENLFTETLIHNLFYSLLKQGFDGLKQITEYINNNEITIFLTDCNSDIFNNPEMFYTHISDLI
jgi:hypothetical protein